MFPSSTSSPLLRFACSSDIQKKAQSLQTEPGPRSEQFFCSLPVVCWVQWVTFGDCGRFVVAFVNASNGIPLCIHDYDSDTSGRFCAGQSPNTTERVLPVRGGTIHHNAPNPYGQCAQLCITLGYLGTAGLEYGNQ